MRLYVLGAGTPTPTKDQFGTSFVLQAGDDYLMIDCGPAATHKLVKVGLVPTQIDYLFFTHHHYDHNSDYPGFLLCRWNHMTPEVNELQIWGPEPTQWMTERLIGEEGAFSPDWKARVGHPASQLHYADRGGTLPRPAPSFAVTDIGPGKITEQNGWTVTAARARHGEPLLDSLAYRVDSDEGSIVFAVDTGPGEAVSQLTQGVDALVISLWDHQDGIDKHWAEVRAAIPDAPIRTMMGTIEAATMAQECGVKTLIVTHALPSLTKPGSKERGIGDMTRVYDGEIVFAQELMMLTLT